MQRTESKGAVVVRSQSKGGGGFSLRRLCVGSRAGSKSGLGGRRVTRREKVDFWGTIVIRLCELAAAVWYIVSGIQAATHSLMVMRGYVDYTPITGPYFYSLLPHYVGESTLRVSPLVVETLGNLTVPRNGTIYLHSESNVSSEGCGSDIPTYNAWTYNDSYLRQNLDDLTAGTSYHFTFLDENELITPIVDCSSTAINIGDNSAARVFYLVRNKLATDDVSILTWSLSAQDYVLPAEVQVGAGAFMTLTLFNDMRATNVEYFHAMRLGFPFQMNTYQPYKFHKIDSEGFWVIESIPRDTTIEASKVVSTACRSGIYVNSLTEQCNMRSLFWKYGATPLEAMEVWDWLGYSMLRDSWAWVHAIHFLFALDATYNILLLITIVYRNARKGKLWIGDAFVSISSSLLLRGVLILATWVINDFWTLMEFAINEGSVVTGYLPIATVFDQIIYADLLAIYLGLAGFVGHVLRERIDPAFVVLLFHLGFQYRRTIITWFPSILAITTQFADTDFFRALAPMEPKHEALTPMRLWTIHQLPAKDAQFIFASLFPIFASFVVVIAYVPARKVYLHFYPPRKIVLGSRVTAASGSEADSTAWKGSLTVFEIATGAPLQNRVGLVSNYDNCVFIKGMKFASADGIYCNGFVIANGKWLVSTNDLPTIFLMIITRMRFKNVYAYQVDGHTVQSTARLVYPNTMTLRELLQLNINMLS